MTYHWPGNVRELQNIIERNVLLAKGDVLDKIELPVSRQSGSGHTPAELPAKTIREIEKEHILTVLKKCNHRITGQGGAAEFLNLPPSTLYSKIKKLGIAKKQY